MNSRTIFQNATLKLTVLYLAIIMFISLVFSIGLYRVSAQEVQRGIRSQGPVGQILRSRNAELIEDFLQEQDDFIADAKARIRNDLIVINLLILFSGGFISYYLAKRSLEPIEKAHEAQSRFTADASHELRTPITAMRAETELALTEDKLTLKKARDQLKSNIEELDKLTSLSEGLLQLARLDNSDFEKDHVSVPHIIEQAVELSRTKAQQKLQNISVDKLPDTQIYGNQPALVQSLVILIDNALKYSPKNSEIKIRAKSLKNTVKISISDKGEGIRTSELPHIFDRFYRADASRHDGDTHGYGIGLSIAQAIIDLHDGKISVKSTLDKGSTFTITLSRS